MRSPAALAAMLVLLAAREGRAQTDHCLTCLNPPCNDQVCADNTTTLYIGGLFATYDGNGDRRSDDLDGALEEEAHFHAAVEMINNKNDNWSASPPARTPGHLHNN